jgi:hypothetical protein
MCNHNNEIKKDRAENGKVMEIESHDQRVALE